MKIRLTRIILDTNIEKIVMQYGGNMHKYYGMVQNLGLLGLSEERLDSVLCAIRDGIELPPIKVSQNTVGYYYIENGRHRVAAYIICGIKEIEAEVV